MTEAAIETGTRSIGAAIKPYIEPAPLAAFFLGVSSGFPYAMIAATLTTRLAQDGISKKTVTAFALAFLVYNFKWLWAWIVDGVRLGEKVVVSGGFLLKSEAAKETMGEGHSH